MFAEPTLHRIEDGFEIACDEYGDPKGEPVFFFHGWPASRLQGAGFGPDARELGLRILSLDRPGIGRSSFRPNRRLLDWPPVVAEVARQLGIGQFRVLGNSGGGPYTLVTAWAFPERVLAAGVISGAPPLPAGVEPELLPLYRLLLGLYRRRPGLMRRLFTLGRPLVTLRPPRWLLNLYLRLGTPADLRALSTDAVYEGAFACYREAWRFSGAGVAADGEIYTAPWGFDPREIRVPVRIWHGARDRSFSYRLAERLGATIPNCVVRIVPEEGHYSMPVHQARPVLEDLLACSPESTDRSDPIKTC